METENCRLHKEFIYKLIPESSKTFTFYRPVKDYVMLCLREAEVADVVASHVYDISRLLTEPSCKIIPSCMLGRHNIFHLMVKNCEIHFIVK